MKSVLAIYAFVIFITGYLTVTDVKPDYATAHFESDTPKVFARINDQIVEAHALTYDTNNIFYTDYYGNQKYLYAQWHYVGKGVVDKVLHSNGTYSYMWNRKDSVYIFQKNTREWAIANNLIKP